MVKYNHVMVKFKQDMVTYNHVMVKFKQDMVKFKQEGVISTAASRNGGVFEEPKT